MNKFVFILFFIGCGSSNYDQPITSISSRYPRLAPTKSNGILMSWFTQSDSTNWSLNWSEFSKGKWSKNKIITSGENYFVNWADFPSIFHFGGDTIAAHWLEKTGKRSYDYDVRVVTSSDRGINWSEAQTPHRDGVKGEHGFVSFYRDLSDQLGLVWLDGRDMGGEDHSTGYGAMNLYQTTFSPSGEFNWETGLDDRVCECCPTSSVTTKNSLLIAYRNRSEEEVRDINIIRYANGSWYEPYAVNEDNWKIAGCPVNGPMLASREDEVAIAWYTSPNATPMVNVAFSIDEGVSFQSPIRVDLSQPIGRVDLVWINEEEVVVSWIESADETTNILSTIVSKSGNVQQPRIVSEIEPGRVSGYPQMEMVGQQLFFAWTESGDKGGIKSKWVQISDFR